MFIKVQRSRNDLLVAMGIITVLVSIYGVMIFQQRARLKEEALMYELLALRHAVTVFSFMNGRNPGDLEELMEKGFMDIKGNRKRYVPQNMVREEGLIDPFGNPYMYDRESGWVKTSTTRYNEW